MMTVQLAMGLYLIFFLGFRVIILKHDLSKKSLDTKVKLNCNKAKKLLGWKIKNSLDDGIKKTLIWYKKNI